MKNVILAIGAHPDDIEFGCGGTLRKSINAGSKVYGLILTRGERGNHCTEDNEYKASANFLGFEEIIVLHDLRDGEIKDNADVVAKIEEHIKKIKPDVVYTHTLNDRHQDHRNCSYAVKSAARYVQTLLLFESPSSTVDFSPHIFLDITGTISDKIEALSKYSSQIKKNTIDLDWVRAQAYYWGAKNKVSNKQKTYVEAFEVNHIIE